MSLPRIFQGRRATDRARDERLPIIERQCQDILEQIKAMSDQLSELSRRESQLRAGLTRDAELEPHEAKLQDVLAKETTGAHVARSIRRAELHGHPFPHAVINDVLPDDVYGSLMRGLPPLELFSDRPVNKQCLQVPFNLAPSYSQRVWRYMTSMIVPEFIVPAILDKFTAPVGDWIASNWPDVPPASVNMHSSDGRILLRRRGYRIPPHRDPKWGFITCILYLARKGDSEAWGTALYTVDGDAEAKGAAPHWIDPSTCQHVADVSFKRNRMLVLLNSVGAHGAQIPEDAPPESLERYIYQFRIAPTVESMAKLKSTLPEDRRPFWAGKSVDY